MKEIVVMKITTIFFVKKTKYVPLDKIVVKQTK